MFWGTIIFKCLHVKKQICQLMWTYLFTTLRAVCYGYAVFNHISGYVCYGCAIFNHISGHILREAVILILEVKKTIRAKVVRWQMQISHSFPPSAAYNTHWVWRVTSSFGPSQPQCWDTDLRGSVLTITVPGLVLYNWNISHLQGVLPCCLVSKNIPVMISDSWGHFAV